MNYFAKVSFKPQLSVEWNVYLAFYIKNRKNVFFFLTI